MEAIRMSKRRLYLSLIFICTLCSFSIFSQQIILLDGKNTGRSFDGFGSVESYVKLLYDYPEKQRSEILDYLYLPRYGASLQVIKIPIGYDGCSDASSWQCYKRQENEPANLQRGYATWLALEAKKRNPEIKIAALHWGYPAWAESHEQKAGFIFGFVQAMKEQYNLQVDYIGGNQNESYIIPEVTKILRKKLTDGGFPQVKIVAADEGSQTKHYKVMDIMEKDPDYAQVVDIIGVHYKSRAGDDPILRKAFDFDKPVWSTEDGGGSYKTNGYAPVHQLMKLLLDVKITAAWRWVSTSSHYENQIWPSAGIIKANEPWSGHYVVGSCVWGIAHFTQFIQPGWKMLVTKDSYLQDASGKKTGRYIAYKDPQSKDFSMVIHTFKEMSTGGTDVEIRLKDIGTDFADVWCSDFSQEESQWFLQHPPVKTGTGKVLFRLEPNKVYTLTTTKGQHKMSSAIPAPKAFPFPYADHFDSYQPDGLPKYFVNVNASFEIANYGNGKVLKQVNRNAPVNWHPGSRPVSQPMTLVGNIQWTDYTVKVKGLLENPGKICLGGRFDGKSEGSGNFDAEAYWLSLDETGNWLLFRKDTGKEPENSVTLASGKIVGSGLKQWTELSLSFNGNQITALIEGKQVAQVTDNTYPNGNVALAAMHSEAQDFFTPTKQFPVVLFDDLEIKAPIKNQQK